MFILLFQVIFFIFLLHPFIYFYFSFSIISSFLIFIIYFIILFLMFLTFLLGFGCFSYLVGFILLLAAAIHSSPLICGTQNEKNIIKTPRELSGGEEGNLIIIYLYYYNFMFICYSFYCIELYFIFTFLLYYYYSVLCSTFVNLYY